MNLRKIVYTTLFGLALAACRPVETPIPISTIEQIVETATPQPTVTIEEELIQHNSIIFMGVEEGSISPLYLLDLNTMEQREILPKQWTDMYVDELIVVDGEVYFDSNDQRYHVNLETGKITESDNNRNVLEPVIGFDIDFFETFQPYKDDDGMVHQYTLGEAYFSPDKKELIFSVGKDQYICNDLWLYTPENQHIDMIGECVIDITVGWSEDKFMFATAMGYDLGYSLYMFHNGKTELVSQNMDISMVQAFWYR